MTFKIGTKDFELDKTYAVNLPVSYITDEGKDLINYYLRHETTVYNKNGNEIYEVEYVNGEKVEYVWKTSRGTFPKRLSKYLYDTQKAILTEDQLTRIGNLARSHSIDTETLYLDFTRDFNWSHGDFGDDGSCFWGSHERAREILFNNEALAIRFYRDIEGEQGYARCWIAPIPEGWIFFNGYGLTVLKIAQIVSASCGLYYRKIELTVNNDVTGIVWVGARNSENKGNGYLIGDMLEIKDFASYNLDWDEHHKVTCAHCGTRVTNPYETSNGGSICQTCFDEAYTQCYRCGRAELIEEAAEDYLERSICNYCINYTHIYEECNHCHRLVTYSSAYSFNGNYYCPICYPIVTEREESNQDAN